MSAPVGNQNALGNKGGRRPADKEFIWHKEKWENDTEVRKLEEKIATGVYSVRDVYLLKALKADTAILRNLADKVLATLLEHSGPGGTSVFPDPTNDQLLRIAKARGLI